MSELNSTATTAILIHKMAGARKDAVRINCEADIPDFLFGTVAIDPFAGEIVLACIEGEQRCPLGSVIAYEEKADTPTGWNAWHKANAAETLVEVDGVFYERPQTYGAQEMTDEFPSFLEGADIWRNEDGWSIQTPWGVSTGFPGKAYWVRYGTREDGTPDANILAIDTPSFEAYIVADAEGNDICSLPEWQARVHRRED